MIGLAIFMIVVMTVISRIILNITVSAAPMFKYDAIFLIPIAGLFFLLLPGSFGVFPDSWGLTPAILVASLLVSIVAVNSIAYGKFYFRFKDDEDVEINVNLRKLRKASLFQK